MLEKRPLVGWSDVAKSPEMAETIKKSKKSAIVWNWAFALLFPVGFLIAGLLVDEMSLNEALIIGIGLGLVMLAINVWRIAGMKKPAWDGVVMKKLEKKRYESDRGGGSSRAYMEYIVLIRTEQGKKKRIVERQRDRDMYDYLDVGDRVRYHPALETYEKYDKSKDQVIYCNVCRLRNSIRNDRCERCENLLFK